MVRVAGCDPGTSSLDLLILDRGAVAEQCRFSPEQLQADPAAPAAWLKERGPFDLVAGPSGYGLPLVLARDCSAKDLALMNLVRPEEHGHSRGVVRFSALLRAFCTSALPVVFLPGVIHLPTVPAHRKINRIDMGTADKLCVAALALARHVEQHNCPLETAHLCVLELGSAFTACLVLRGGQIVAGVGGTSGPPGWCSGGCWDGEAAYLLSPLSKSDLFAGGVSFADQRAEGAAACCEELVKMIAGLQAVTPFDQLYLSGRLLESQPDLAQQLRQELERFAPVALLSPLPGAWVKAAAQGAALIADGLAGGGFQAVVERLRLRQASGTVLDWLRYPRAEEVRQWFRD